MTRELDAWLTEHILEMEECHEWESRNMGSAGGPVYIKRCSHDDDKCWNANVGDSPLFGGIPAFSSTGNSMLQLLTCDLPGPWAIHWNITQFREGYYGRWWAGCSITPGWSSSVHPYEWAQHNDLPAAVALALKRAWENKQERLTSDERKAIELRNTPTLESQT